MYHRRRLRAGLGARRPGSDQMSLEVIAADDEIIARGSLERQGDYSPMTLVSLDGAPRREEVWPQEALYALPVLLSGGEVGVLSAWEHAEDHSWWRWSVEFSNHTGRPADWAPPGQRVER